MALSVEPIAALSDNYIWLLKDAATGAVAICDPGEAGPAIAAVEANGGRLDLVKLHIAPPGCVVDARSASSRPSSAWEEM